MDNTFLNGQLEIDHERGVIYFHIGDQEQARKRGVVTALRICKLPKPIPTIYKRSLDIIYKGTCDWK